MRELERTLARVARKAAVEMLEQKTEEITVTQDKLTAYLGQPRYTREPLEKENRVGVVNGLAYIQCRRRDAQRGMRRTQGNRRAAADGEAG